VTQSVVQRRQESPPLGRDKAILGSGLALSALSALAVAEVLYATRWGPGIFFDSVSYLFSARSLAAGGGLNMLDVNGEVRPLTWWPPLFPVLLGSLSKIFGQPDRVARWLNAVMLGAAVLLAGAFAYRLLRAPFDALLTIRETP
jgi:hypothetical protein